MSILGSWAPDFADHALDTAGKAAGSAVDIVTDAAGTIGEGLKYIPAIGPLYSAIWTHVTSPLSVLDGIVKGNPIDQVALDTLHRELQVAKDVAPYAQTAMQFVPGVGPVASGAISAGIALANGQTIDDALVAGVKGMIPGGPLASAAFDMGKSALQGKDPKEIALSAVGPLISASGVPVPPIANKFIATGLHLAQGAAQGKPVDSMLISEAIEQLPPSLREEARVARQLGNGARVSDILLEQGQTYLAGNDPVKRKALSDALKMGIALGTGKHYQDALRDEAANHVPFLAAAGAQMSAVDEALDAARKTIAFHNTAIMKNVAKSRGVVIKPIVRTLADTKQVKAIHFAPEPDGFPWGDDEWQMMQGFAGEEAEDTRAVVQGFDVGTALMSHQVTRAEFEAIRNSLEGEARKGFDSAVALHIGRVTQRIPPGLTPEAEAGYLIVKGLQGKMPGDRKAEIVQNITAQEDARKGAALAVMQIQAGRKSWFETLMEVLF